jgi:hypothetical protein
MPPCGPIEQKPRGAAQYCAAIPLLTYPVREQRLYWSRKPTRGLEPNKLHVMKSATLMSRVVLFSPLERT